MEVELPSKKCILSETSKFFFAAIPIRKYPHQLLQSLEGFIQTDPAFPDALLRATVLREGCEDRPVSIASQRAFVKWILRVVENSDENEERNVDLLYETHCRVLSKEDAELFFKRYFYPPNVEIVIAESRNFIDAGTTGLSSWTASFLMNEWVTANASFFRDRRVLELGSGVGLTGILLALLAPVASLKLTDCHNRVLAVLRKNVDDNLAPDLAASIGLEVVALDWATFRQDFVESDLMAQWELPDVILGCDLVFDENLVPHLVAVIKYFLSYTNSKSSKKQLNNVEIPCAFISSNVRNERTYDRFLKELSAVGLSFEEVSSGVFSSPYLSAGLDDNPNLKLIKIEDTVRKNERELYFTFLPRSLANSLQSVCL